jgi:hypothetical protein
MPVSVRPERKRKAIYVHRSDPLVRDEHDDQAEQFKKK